MGFTDQWQAFTHNPTEFFTQLKDKVLQTTGRKRRREEEADGAGPSDRLQPRTAEDQSRPHINAQHTPAKRSRQEPAAGQQQPQPRLKTTPRSARQLHLSLPPKLLGSRSTAQPFTPAASSLQAGRLRELAAAQTPYHARPGSAAVQAAYAAGASDRGSPQIPAHRPVAPRRAFPATPYRAPSARPSQYLTATPHMPAGTHVASQAAPDSRQVPILQLPPASPGPTLSMLAPAQVQPQGPNQAALADLEKANVLEEQAAGLRAAALSRLNPVTLATLGRVRSQVTATALNLQEREHYRQLLLVQGLYAAPDSAQKPTASAAPQPPSPQPSRRLPHEQQQQQQQQMQPLPMRHSFPELDKQPASASQGLAERFAQLRSRAEDIAAGGVATDLMTRVERLLAAKDPPGVMGKEAKRLQAKQPEPEVLDLASSGEDASTSQAASRLQGSDGDESMLSEQLSRSILDDASEDSEAQAQSRIRVSNKQRVAARRVLDRDADPEEVIAQHKNTNISIARKDMLCLLPGVWLNDEVVNVYMGLLQDRDSVLREQGHEPRTWFFNSFFASKLYMDSKSYSYKAVARWTKAAKLRLAGQGLFTSVLQYSRLVVPLNHGNSHWTCAVIDLAHQELVHLDSMNTQPSQVMQALRKWVQEEYKDKLQKEVDTSTWPIRWVKAPQQENCHDCGVFTLTFADYSSRAARLCFSQRDMPSMRLRVAADISLCKVLTVTNIKLQLFCIQCNLNIPGSRDTS